MRNLLLDEIHPVAFEVIMRIEEKKKNKMEDYYKVKLCPEEDDSVS